MTESTKRRALNAYAAMGTLPDAYILSAEEALYEAEAGIYRPAKPMGPVRRFLNSGLGAAVISGIVALTVLLLIIHAGQQPPVHGPNQPPLGSSITISEEGADFTIATEEDCYLPNTNRITVIMTGVTPGKAISMTNGWYLEWLTDEGAETVGIYYTEEATISAKPARGQYATLQKTILIDDAKGYALRPGTYRLHATVYNGEEYVSVAWCEFEVRVPEPMTEPVTAGPTVLQTTSEAAINLHTFQAQYPSGATSVTVVVTNANVGMGLVLDNEWELCRVLLSPDGVNILEEVPVRQADDTNRILIPNEYECAQGHVVLNTDGLEDGLYYLTATHTDNTLFYELASCFFVVGSLDHEGYRSDSGIITTYVTCELYLFPGLSTFLLKGPVPNYSAEGTYEERDGYLYLTINAGTEWETRWVFKREDKTLMAVTDMATGFFANDFPDGSCLYRASQGTP